MFRPRVGDEEEGLHGMVWYGMMHHPSVPSGVVWCGARSRRRQCVCLVEGGRWWVCVCVALCSDVAMQRCSDVVMYRILVVAGVGMR